MSRQVPRRQRLMWGLGGYTDATILYGMFSLINAIYVNALGVNAVLVGIACAIPRFLDSATDPLVGYLSDSTRSPWGRRRPWLLAGLLISAASGLLLWHAPMSHDSIRQRSGMVAAEAAVDSTDGLHHIQEDILEGPGGGEGDSLWMAVVHAIETDWGTFLYLSTMITLLMAVGYTMVNVPHYAMGYEMTTDYDERTHLFKWRFVFFAAAGFTTPWLLPLCMWFEGDQAQVLRGSEGVFPVAILVGIIILATGVPSLFCKEHAVVAPQVTRIRFWQAVRFTLGNRAFQILLASNFIARFGMAITGIFFYYIFVYHIGKGEQLAGAGLLAVFFNTINIATFIAMPAIAALSGRIGKKSTLVVMLSMSALAYASLMLTFTNTDDSFLRYNVSLGGTSWTLFLQWPSILTGALIGMFTNTMPMITNSMIADICDDDELRSGRRREGFYGAVYTSIEKMAWSISLAFQGVVLVASGFNAALTLQSPETVQFWFLALMVTQPVGFLVGIVIILFYPLSRARLGEIRRALDARARTAGAAEGA